MVSPGPDRRASRHAATYVGVLACGCRPEQALFVGDSVTADVEGPMTVGIPAVHLPRTRQPSSAPRRVADFGGLQGLPAP